MVNLSGPNTRSRLAQPGAFPLPGLAVQSLGTGTGQVEGTKTYMVRAVSVEAERVTLYYRMQLSVAPDGMIRTASCESSSFGFLPEALEGVRLFESLVDGWPVGVDGLALLQDMYSRGRAEDDQSSYRVAVRASNGLLVPAVMSVVAAEASGGFLVQLSRAELLEAIIDVDAKGRREYGKCALHASGRVLLGHRCLTDVCRQSLACWPEWFS